MIGNLVVQARTGLSPEWDRWFDEAFTDLVSSDDELVRAEFDALMAETWPPPPAASGDEVPPQVPPQPERARKEAEPSGRSDEPDARPPP